MNFVQSEYKSYITWYKNLLIPYISLLSPILFIIAEYSVVNISTHVALILKVSTPSSFLRLSNDTCLLSVSIKCDKRSIQIDTYYKQEQNDGKQYLLNTMYVAISEFVNMDLLCTALTIPKIVSLDERNKIIRVLAFAYNKKAEKLLHTRPYWAIGSAIPKRS